MRQKLKAWWLDPEPGYTIRTLARQERFAWWIERNILPLPKGLAFILTQVIGIVLVATLIFWLIGSQLEPR